MKKKRHGEEEIIRILKEAESASSSGEVCRRHGIHPQTLVRWRAKFGGMNVSEARRLRQLEDENRRLKHLVADLSLDNRVLKEIVEKHL